MSKITKINKLFEKQAALYPNNIAIIHEDKKITYAELNEQANQFVQVMINQGIQPGDLVPCSSPDGSTWIRCFCRRFGPDLMLWCAISALF
jgi:non-ribosomal peptide synthetase component F